MYLGKRKIFNTAEYEERRKKCNEYKPDAFRNIAAKRLQAHADEIDKAKSE